MGERALKLATRWKAAIQGAVMLCPLPAATSLRRILPAGALDAVVARE